MKKKALIVAGIVTLLLVLDQFIKIYVKTHFDPWEKPVPVLGDWFVMDYIENQGMAFGTTFGSSMWSKLALSLFRIVAISALVYYWLKQVRKGASMEFLFAIGLVFAGATGNLIDSMCYDYIFAFNPCYDFNWLEGSGNYAICDMFGQREVEVRHTGFLFGNVVDMFKFQANWPTWMPWLGGKEVFPAIWNLADACITLGVITIFVRQRKYFPKKAALANATETESAPGVEEISSNEAASESEGNPA